MKVAHLLLASQPDGDQMVIDRALELRNSIVAGKIEWRAAVAQHSIASSSKESGGEIGWIEYSGPMVPEFSLAAMGLEPGEISAPVKTGFGVHLIKCLEVQPGSMGPRDAQQTVRADAMNSLFQSLARDQRRQTEIELRADWAQVK
jgi:peptidyl-prolyl cis-trans isomerase SurA